MPRVLIFPAGVTQARTFASEVRANGGAPVGASSLDNDPEASAYADWIKLPYVHDDAFARALTGAVERYGITEAYVPHPVAWQVVRDVVARESLAVRLLNDDPLDAVSVTYRRAIAAAAPFDAVPALSFGHEENAAPRLTPLQRAALFQATERVSGMCSIEKQFVLSEIARSIPAGDLVEIGSWWGKSAFLIASLAERFGLGNLLCVDPWSVDYIDQSTGDGILDNISRNLDCEEAFRVFTLNLAGINGNRVNYLRAPSVEGAAQYRRFPGTQTTPEFGSTAYSGTIALLHIDGNHAYDAARADIEAWAPALCPGGWLAIDDYNWAYGDGPRRAGDEYLSAYADGFEHAFVAAGTLFARRVS